MWESEEQAAYEAGHADAEAEAQAQHDNDCAGQAEADAGNMNAVDEKRLKNIKCVLSQHVACEGIPRSSIDDVAMVILTELDYD